MKVTATRTGGWWALEADFAGQPVYTQARRLDQAEAQGEPFQREPHWKRP